jgi:hypothetical protein
MKTIAKIHIAPRLVGSELYRKLGAIYSEGVGPHTFSCALPHDDTRVAAIQKVLSGSGFFPNPERGRRSETQYWMKLIRVYSDDDLASFAYLNPRPEVPFRSHHRSPDGLIELDSAEVPAQADIGFAGPRWIVVSKSLKVELERGGFRNLLFRPTKIVGKEPERFAGMFWELTSDKLLPSLSPVCKFADCATGDDVSSDSPRAIGVAEREPVTDIPYEIEELYYAASAIREAGEFDLARTREDFGDCRYPVASQRLYRFCRDRKLKVDWRPVHVDPD